MKTEIWGRTTKGVEVPSYTLTSVDIEVRVMAYGARIVSIRTPDQTGRMSDISLGYDRLEDYLRDTRSNFGSVVGRYGNRIANGRFTIDGETFQIPVNNGHNALHGGPIGFDRYVWKAHPLTNGVEFEHVSSDGDMGFPGTLTAKARYSVTGNTLRIDYAASTDRATALNLTNHAYFNLRGDDKRDILDEQLKLNASLYTPVDSGMIPLGELASVVGTPFDFRAPTAIGARIEDDNVQLKTAGGYDHNFVVDGPAGTLRLAAIATDTESGRNMIVETTEPALQFYSGNNLDGTFTGRHGKRYEKHAGFCLETQHFPDSPNHPNFPNTVLRPGEMFRSTTTFAFGRTSAK